MRQDISLSDLKDTSGSDMLALTVDTGKSADQRLRGVHVCRECVCGQQVDASTYDSVWVLPFSDEEKPATGRPSQSLDAGLSGSPLPAKGDYRLSPRSRRQLFSDRK